MSVLKSGGGLRIIRPRNGYGVRKAAAGGGNWWEISGQTCVAAYQPKGAASLADSYVNLANSGTYDAAPGVAPTWNATDGWIFNGSTQYLDTGIVPANDQAWSMIVCFSGATGTTDFATMIGVEDPAGVYFELRPYHNSTNKFYSNGDFVLVNETPPISGIMAVAGVSGYLDGVLDVTGIASKLGTRIRSIYVGAVNKGGASLYWLGNIQAIAIYSTTLSADDVATLTTAMNAL